MMNRRDVIIVAVFINIGLLVTLFVSALKREPGELVVNHSRSSSQIIANSQEGKINSTSAPVCHVEQSIKESNVSSQAVDNLNKEYINKKPVTKELPAAALQANPVSITKEKPSLKTVVVKKGDVLEKIARLHSVSLKDLTAVNKLSNDHLKVGQVLDIPHVKQSSSVEKSNKSPQFYTVQDRDNPWTIAKKNGVKVDDLLKLNNLDHKQAKRLRPGDRLRIQ